MSVASADVVEMAVSQRSETSRQSTKSKRKTRRPTNQTSNHVHSVPVRAVAAAGLDGSTGTVIGLSGKKMVSRSISAHKGSNQPVTAMEDGLLTTSSLRGQRGRRTARPVDHTRRRTDGWTNHSVNPLSNEGTPKTTNRKKLEKLVTPRINNRKKMASESCIAPQAPFHPIDNEEVQRRAMSTSFDLKPSNAVPMQLSRASSPKVEEHSQTRKTLFGNPLLPIDIVNLWNDEVPATESNGTKMDLELNEMHDKQAPLILQEIRSMKRHELLTQFLDSPSNGTRPQGHQQPRELKVIQMLKSAGKDDCATLTMTGVAQTGNKINQDRALIVQPYFIDALGQQQSRGASSSHLHTQMHASVNNIYSAKSSSFHNGSRRTYQPRRCLMGVFDGHGEIGHLIAEHCQSQLPLVLAAKLCEKKLELETRFLEVAITKKALIDTFIHLDKTAPQEQGGCTASVVFRQGGKIYVANTGDSRSFVAVYRKQTQSVSIVFMSREDKPDILEERDRILQRGGEVLYNEKTRQAKVVVSLKEKKHSATLGMSRSIGDKIFEEYGVIANPVVDVLDIHKIVWFERQNSSDNSSTNSSASAYTALDESVDFAGHFGEEGELSDDDVYVFAVSASDGMMIDRDTAEGMAYLLSRSLFEADGPHPLTGCEILVQQSAAIWKRKNKGKYRDDITVAVVALRSPPLQGRRTPT